MDLYEQLGKDLNPATAWNELAGMCAQLAVNYPPKQEPKQQGFSSAYRESITKLAEGIYHATQSILSLLSPLQLQQLQTLLLVEHDLNYRQIYEKDGVWYFERAFFVHTLKDMETDRVLHIMEAAEKLLLP